jgi:uncharacterized protein
VDAPGRVVLDPNVLVSAAITSSGAVAEILDLIDASVITPVVSPALLTELTLVLRRDKFRAYLDLGAALAFVAEVERLAETWDDPDSDSTAESPDPDDAYLIALARSAQADALVSGDRDLTTLDLLTCWSCRPVNCWTRWRGRKR